MNRYNKLNGNAVDGVLYETLRYIQKDFEAYLEGKILTWHYTLNLDVNQKRVVKYSNFTSELHSKILIYIYIGEEINKYLIDIKS